MGWGSQTRGTTSWGGDGAAAGGGGPVHPGGGGSSTVSILDAEILSNDAILVTFSEPISGNDALNKNNWFISPALNLVGVQASVVEGDPVDSVILSVNGINYGTTYTVSTNNLVGSSGSALSPSSTGSFVGRNTKLDKVLTSTPVLYDTSLGSVVRAVLGALFREDDKIGGSKEEEN